MHFKIYNQRLSSFAAVFAPGQLGRAVASLCMMFLRQKRLAQNGIRLLTCSSRPGHRRMLLPARHSEARLGSWRALL